MAKYCDIKNVLQEYYKNNIQRGRKYIFDHFIAMGVPERSLNRWLTQLEATSTLERKKGSGRPVRIATKATVKRLENNFNHKSGRSQRKMSRKLSCSQAYVSIILKKYTSVRCYKKTKRPKMSELQKAAARPKCRKMLATFGKRDFIIDDECYLTLSCTTLSGNDRFYSNNLQNTPQEAKNSYVSKFEPKLLVWIAISPRGKSKVVFFKSGLAINKNVYQKECLERRLIPFIKQYYSDGQYVFWPDLASSHYASSVQEYLRDQNVTFVPKNMNPANVPKARPIEDFWAILKQNVYNDNWQATNIGQLKKRVTWCLSKLDSKLIQRLAQSTAKRLDTVARHGVDSL
jgi:hypothetical protein